MNEPMTKARLLETLRAKRAAWDAVLAEIPESRMTESGAAGKWSVKDVIAHLTYFERWMADRLQEHLRGENYVPTEMDFMEDDPKNEIIYQQHRDDSLQAVQAESRRAFRELVEGLEAHPESFLIEPQQFEGSPMPVVIWKLVEANIYEHYGIHMPSIKEWLAAG